MSVDSFSVKCKVAILHMYMSNPYVVVSQISQSSNTVYICALLEVPSLVTVHEYVSDIYGATLCGVLLCQVVDKRLMDGADEYLQLMDLASVIMEQLCHAHS